MDIRRIEKLISEYKSKIGLSDWVITARRPEKDKHKSNRAWVISDPIQRRAITSWNLNAPDWQAADDDEREQVILHELCHLLLSRYSQVVHDVIQKYVIEEKRDDLLIRIDDQEEALCGQLSLIFHQLIKDNPPSL